VLNALALAAIVLVATDCSAHAEPCPRLAILLPAGLALYLHVSSFGFSVGLQAGALAAGTTSSSARSRSVHAARGRVPLLVALHLWPTCLSPLALVRGLC
jgi:hypothetical protein